MPKNDITQAAQLHFLKLLEEEQKTKGRKGPHPFVHMLNVPVANLARREIIFMRLLLLDGLYRAVAGDRSEILFITTRCKQSELFKRRVWLCELADLDPSFFYKVSQEAMAGEILMPPWRVWRYIWTTNENYASPHQRTRQ